MKFGPVGVDDAEGMILGHNITGRDGRKILSKGKRLEARDLSRLREAGRSVVYVASLEPGDVDEDSAALRVARAISGEGLELTTPRVGRVNLMSISQGVVGVNAERLNRLNGYDGITVATLSAHTVVEEGKMIATVKIIPYALPELILRAVEDLDSQAGPIIRVRAIVERSVVLILSGSPFAKERIMKGFLPPIQERLEELNASLTGVEFVPLEDEEGEQHLAETIQLWVKSGVDMIILAGETAIMDPLDIAPRAVVRAGGQIVSFGAPVDPGNLLMLAYHGEVPVLGAPGCARSRRLNVVDWILPPLLAGERLGREDIVRLGHGGLLEDVPERPMPRALGRDPLP